MSSRPFVHLHTHSCYSLLDGAIRIPALVEAAAEMGMPALALTDHGSMFGLIEFFEAARGASLSPILGAELYVTTGPKEDHSQGQRNIRHLVLLVRNETGYRNLVELSTTGYLEGYYYRPRVDHRDLERHAEGLIALSSCLKGEIPHLLLEERFEEARARALWYRDLFGPDGFYLELQDHGLPEERTVLPSLLRLARETGIPVVATNDAHYLRKEHAQTHKILLSISSGKPGEHGDEGLRFSSTESYFKSPEEMASLFADCPEALEATVRIAESCTFSLPEGTLHLPAFPLPPEFDSPDAYLRHLAFEGARRIFGDLPEQVSARLEYELGVMTQRGLAGYFLIVHDFVREAQARGIPMGPGRGSAAGSLVCYCLGITKVDPLRHGLSFERFLTLDRRSMPDIDLDFCQERREELIQYALARYGSESVAHIASFGTIKARAAVRDVGRVLGLSFEETDVLSKMVPEGVDVTLEGAIQDNPELRKRIESNPQYQELFAHARVLEGIARHSSTHPAGIVIAPRPLRTIVPLFKPEREAGAMVTTQYDMKSIEKIGLLKIDLLGLRTVTVIAETVELIARHRGIHLDLETLPLDDTDTYRLLAKGETVGVFQVESAGMTNLLKRMEPDCFSHIVAVNALYRPGPLETGAPRYVERRHGREPKTYPHEDLEPILAETYGVLLYQEQVMKTAQVLAGFDAAKADKLRKAMAKKKAEDLATAREEFVAGAVSRGVDQGVAASIYEEILPFAGYAFNKAHATAYGLLIYQTAYLKAHYPLEFMCANLSSFMDQTDRLRPLIDECRRLGITVLGPDVNRSSARFAIEGQGIRYGLAAVKNLGRSAAEAIVAERDRGGPFRSLFDFARRVDVSVVSRGAAESLIKAGAFDSLTNDRAALMQAVGVAMEEGKRHRRAQEESQLMLFAPETTSGVSVDPPLPDVEPWGVDARLAAEQEALGFHFSGHPLMRYRWVFSRRGIRRPGECAALPEGASVTVGGQVVRLKRLVRDGKPPCSFADIEDDRGATLTAAFFEDACAASNGIAEPGALVLLQGKLKTRKNERQLLVSRVAPLEGVWRQITDVRVLITAESAPEEACAMLGDVLGAHPGSRSAHVEVALPGGSTVVVLLRNTEVEPNEALFEALSALPFVSGIEVTVGAP